jgi:hypothetical protein
MFLALVLGAAIPADADTLFDISSGSFTYSGGNRRVDSLGFAGSADTFGAGNFAQWDDGRLRRISDTGVVDTFGWNDAIPRDASTSGNVYSANPDRDDNAPPFSGGDSTGTLREVFGPTLGAPPSQNLSYIIDGEAVGQTYGPNDNLIYQLDLIFGGGRFIVPDADATTVELAILERGLNSAIRVFGILDAGSGIDDAVLTAGQLVDFRDSTTLYRLNTLEIGSAQPVGGVGVSLDSLAGLSLVGIRLQYDIAGNMNGPDIVAVGTVNAIPEPSTLALAAIGAPASIVLARRFRRRRLG